MFVLAALFFIINNNVDMNKFIGYWGQLFMKLRKIVIKLGY